MVLKAVELFGFKSFADKCRIEFTDGISALLGPNGCGKSNVVDAVKWVVGEQSTKSLRAEKMEDVIFNGTESRKPLNVAEVTLLLSNEESILPLEMPEIAIKRRLYRNGESEYLINNSPARLKEIRELFLDTGIGKSAYSVMEQGKIDQILSNKPEERRTVFEEAAGITKYKIRGAEAERKLQRTEENMTQVENILKEVRRSYDTLKVQAEKTVSYRSLQDTIFSLELDLALLRMKDFLENQNKKNELLKTKTAERDGYREKINEINNSLEVSLDMVNSMESKLVENQKKLYGLDLEKSNKENQIQLLYEREKETNKQIESATAREHSILEKLETLEKQIGEKEALLSELTQQIEENRKNIDEFTENITFYENRIRENDEKVSENEKAIQEFEQKREDLQEDLRSITDDIVTQLDSKLQETGYSYRERKQIEEALDYGLQSVKIAVEGKVNLLGDVENAQDINKNNLKDLLRQSREAFAEAYKQVEAVIMNFTRYKAAVPSFLDEFLAPQGIITRKRGIDARLEKLSGQIGDKRKENGKLAGENRELSKKIEESRRTLEELRMNSVRMNTQKSNVTETLESRRSEQETQKKELNSIRMEIDDRKSSLSRIGKQIHVIQEEKKGLDKEEVDLKQELADLEKNISKNNKELLDKEKRMKDYMGKSDDVQRQVEKYQMELASIETDIRNLYENFEEKYSRDLSEYEEKIYEIKQPKDEIRTRLQQAKEELRSLGQINLMAPEEFEEVKERYEFLTGQLKDLEKAREDLKKITKQILEESEELFIRTYEKIKKNFHSMFRRLFGGGRAELSLADSDNVLESGIEIYAQPPGKKLENIALLSGGERSLTAVALLFAMYMVRPSPFCILDEIDAALDEHNVGRFINLLEEFSRTSQFIIITHNKKTVAGADALLGITMEESGVSKVVSIKLDREEIEEPVV